MFDERQLSEVLSHVEQLVIRLRNFAKALQEAIAAKHREVKFELHQNLALHLEDLLLRERAI